MGGSKRPVPGLVWSDAWLLSAVLFAGQSPITLSLFLATADRLNHAIPEFDEVSFGVPRLVAACLLEVSVAADGAVAFAPTRHSSELVGNADRGDIELMFEIANKLGCGYHEAQEFDDSELGRLADALRYSWAPELEDRSLGRLAGLKETDWRRAVDDYCYRDVRKP